MKYETATLLVALLGFSSAVPAPKPVLIPRSSSDVATRASGAGVNVQTFTGTLGGPAPPVVSSDSERPFNVAGDTFLNEAAAIQRSCAKQNTVCSNAVNAGTLAGSDVGDCNAQESACNAAGSAKGKRAALDFGTCTDPSIVFKSGLDGRDQPAFIANNQGSFPHGSALKIGVIAQFICGQLSSSCKASAAAIAACTKGETASASLTGQASADAFNAALGV